MRTCPSGELSWWGVALVGVVLVGNCPGGSYLVGNCPVGSCPDTASNHYENVTPVEFV